MAFLETGASLSGFEYGLLLAVPLIPLAGYAVQMALRKRLPWGDKLLTAGMGVAMVITVYMAFKVIGGAHHEGFFHESARANPGWAFKWLSVALPWNDAGNISAGILYDPL